MALINQAIRIDDLHHAIFGTFDSVTDPYSNDTIVVGPFAKSLVEIHGGNDTVYGNDGNDTIVDAAGGNPASGTVVAGLHTSGNDTIHAGRGNDVIVAGDGRNLYDGGDDFDIVDYSRASHAIKVDLGQGAASADGQDTLQSIEGVIGSGFDDMLIGSSGPDLIRGGEGNDTIEGGDNGDDTLIGGLGDDRLFGGFGNDVLNGGEGADVLRGGAGSDNLTGGSGADTFYFDIALYHGFGANRTDTIMDFHEGEDKLEIVPGSGQALTFAGNVSVAYDTQTDVTVVTVVDGAHTLAIDLNGHHVLTASDFIFG